MSSSDKNNTPNMSQNDGDEDSELMDFLRRVAESHLDDSSNDDTEAEGMDANEYHNKAVDYARRSNYARAVQVCKRGLKFFPNDIDLLADTIKYSCETGDLKTAKEFYERLITLPRTSWNWRAYTFCFDYLVLDPINNEENCRTLIKDYKVFIPYEEKAYMSESELEAALGNQNRSMMVLVEAIDKLPNAPQCALRLADMQLDRGLFDAVLKTCNYCLSASCEVQPSINIPYLLLVRALAKDALLHKRFANEEHVDQEEIDVLLKEYAALREDFPEMARHSRVIHIREKCLKVLKIIT